MCPQGLCEIQTLAIKNIKDNTMTGRLWQREPLLLPLIIVLTVHGFSFFYLFVKLHVQACPIKALQGTATCCKFASCSHCRQRCQLARHSDLSSYFNMLVSCMQMLSSQCLHSVPVSTRCVQPHTHKHTKSQTEIYCVISAAEGSRQIKKRKKGNWRKVIYQEERLTSDINNGVYGFIDGKSK